MATEQVNMVLTAEDRASAAIRNLMGEMRALKRLAQSFGSGLKKDISGLNFGTKDLANFRKTQDGIMRGLRQRGQEEKTQDRIRTAGAREQIRLDRYRMALRMRHERELGLEMRRQASFQLAGERQRAAALRETARHDRYRMGLRTRHERDEVASERRAQRDEDRRRAQGRRDLRSGWGHANDAGGRIIGSAHTISIGAGITAGIVAKIAETGLGARSRTDTAEANLRMFGGLNRSQVDAARRGWINRSAVENGFRPSSAINAYTEVLKAGIPESAAPGVTKSIMGGAAGLDLNVTDTTKLIGRLATLTQDPKKFDGGAIDRMLNGIAVVAKVTAADSNELVSSLRRGAGVLGSTKMSVEDLTAFTGIGISAGMQEGKAGTFMDFLVNEMVNAKNARGQRREDLSKGFGMLGLGSNAAVSRQAASDPTALLLNMFERMSKMNPEKAGHVASLIGMREWRGEILQMMRGTPMLRQTVEAGRDPKNANHLKQARDERLGTLAGLRSQLVATFDLAWEAVGGGIEDIVREIGNFFLGLGKNLDFDVIKAHVKTLIDGFVDGLGFKSITEMLEKGFGKPDLSTVNTFFRFAQGFGQGVREVIDTLKSIVKLATGQDGDAGALGRWAARITGFALALSMLSPFIGVLAGLGGAVVALGFALSKLGSLGSLSGLASTLVRGLGLGLVAEIGSRRGEIVTYILDAVKSLWAAIKDGLVEGFSIKNIIAVLKNELTPAPLQRWMNGGAKTEEQNGGTWQDPPAKRNPSDPNNAGREGPPHPLDRVDEPKKKKRKRTEPSSGDESLRRALEPASFATMGDMSDSVEKLGASLRAMGAHLQSVSLTGDTASASLASTASQASAGMRRGVSGLSGSFKPQGMTVPGWYGRSRGGGGGGGGGSGPGIPDSVPMTEQERNTLGLIMKYEGGGKNQMNYMGKRLGLDPNTAKGYTAQGYFQMLNSNWRRIAPKLGIKTTNAMSSSLEDQTRVALHLLRNGGVQNWTNYNPRLRAALARGEKAPSGSIPESLGVPSIAGSVPDITGPLGSTKGLRIKSSEALAGGATNPAIIAAAQMIHGGNIAGGLNRFTAFNDLYHKGTGSKHALGLAGDFTLKDASQSGAAAEQVRRMFRSAGLSDDDFRVIDEYKNPSRRSTGGHIHYQINSAIAAAKYAKALQAKAATTANALNETADVAKRAYGGGPAKPPTDKPKDIGDGFTSTGWRKPTTDEIVSRQPPGVGGRGGGGGSGGHGSAPGGPVTIHVNGAGELPDVLAQKIQMRVTKDWNHRAHDLEPELT
ncbi:hypothetical protein D8770_22840 [Methylobacterium sp. DB1607]|nr:hypothetical protein [Methylobacterium sp. DB1607]